MRSLILIIASTLLFSCINEKELHDVFPTHQLNANSSKVWILNQSDDPMVKDIPEMKAYRTCFILFDNYSFKKQKLIFLGSTKGSVGKYTIKKDRDENRILTFYYPEGEQQSLQLIIKKIGNTQLTLERKSNDDSYYTWEFNTMEAPFKN